MDGRRQQQIVEAFLAASRLGDFETLVALLDPDAVLRADRAAVVKAATANRVHRGAPLLAPEVRGARAVAAVLSGRATAAQVALIDVSLPEPFGLQAGAPVRCSPSASVTQSPRSRS